MLKPIPKPTLFFEKKLWKKQLDLIGVDEVGRGALAGPLITAAVCFPKNVLKIDGLADSKLLKPQKRKQLAKIIKKRSLSYALGECPVVKINKLGITKATAYAFRKAIKKCLSKMKNPYPFILVDGFYVKFLPGGLKKQKAVKKGDQKVFSIAAASIIAKVHRDKIMRRLSYKNPQYKWGKNKGYGTKKHLQALKKYGPTLFHRKKFIKTILPTP